MQFTREEVPLGGGHVSVLVGREEDAPNTVFMSYEGFMSLLSALDVDVSEAHGDGPEDPVVDGGWSASSPDPESENESPTSWPCPACDADFPELQDLVVHVQEKRCPKGPEQIGNGTRPGPPHPDP